MTPEPRKVSTTPSAIPAMMTPEPRPSRMSSNISSTAVIPLKFKIKARRGDGVASRHRGAAAVSPLSVRGQSRRSGGGGDRLEPASRLREHVLALVVEELRPVVADGRRGRELAAVEGRGAEGLRALAR